jgi:hypothetical protein
MRDEPVGDVADDMLLHALTSTVAVLVIDGETLRSHSGRVAFATTAQLAARSGARVFLVAPEHELDRPLPPLRGSHLVGGLLELGADLLPGCAIELAAPRLADIAILFGGTVWDGTAAVTFRATASSWRARLIRSGPLPGWEAVKWPFGGLAVAALAAAEIFKASMRKLAGVAQNPALHAELFAPAESARYGFDDPRLEPGPGAAPFELGSFDMISAGAIAQSALYCLAQLPDVRGDARLIEPETSDATNLNRYMLLRRSRLGMPKALDLASQELGGLTACAILERFTVDSAHQVLPLRDRVLVGVDHIPTRWAAQSKWPKWLGVGATSHYCALVSHHANDLPCAGCLHPRDDADAGVVPTAAFVTFWSGILLAARIVRDAGGDSIRPGAQQEYLTSLRPEMGGWRSPVAPRSDCPVGCHARASRPAA